MVRCELLAPSVDVYQMVDVLLPFQQKRADNNAIVFCEDLETVEPVVVCCITRCRLPDLCYGNKRDCFGVHIRKSNLFSLQSQQQPEMLLCDVMPWNTLIWPNIVV